MSNAILRVAFSHHIWATMTLIDACASLDAQQLETSPAGTYGSVIDTLRHVVAGDCAYLELFSDGDVAHIDEGAASISELREVIVSNGAAWDEVLSSSLDANRMVVRHRTDGSESHAPVGIRLAQVLHHGSDHRSQVCTALTTLGIEPPGIDTWDYAEAQGWLSEVPPPS